MAFNRLNHSVLGEIRPRFALKIEIDPETASMHLEKSARSSKTVTCVRSNNLLFLNTPSWLRHYWSPEMTVRIEKGEFSGITKVSCLIGPNQTVWVMFAFIYGALLFATIFAGMFGYVQYSQTGSSPFLWGIPIGLFVTSSIFITSKIGQRKGHDQMLVLVSFLYHHLSEITTVERIN